MAVARSLLVPTSDIHLSSDGHSSPSCRLTDDRVPKGPERSAGGLLMFASIATADGSGSRAPQPELEPGERSARRLHVERLEDERLQIVEGRQPGR